jgi:hypothetical protein
MKNGLRLDALVALGNCRICGKAQLESPIPLFYVVEITRHGFDSAAVRRAVGLTMQVGALASVLGPDEPLTKPLDGPYRVFVHEECADQIHHLLELFPETPDVDPA